MPRLQQSRITDNFKNRIEMFGALPDDALSNVYEIEVLSGRSNASIWRDVREGRLAPPIKIGPNSTRWRVSDVRRYLAGGA